MSPRSRRLLLSAVWLVVLPGLLWLYLKQLDSARLRQAIGDIRWAPLLAAVAVLFLLVLSKGRRLRLLLSGTGQGQDLGTGRLTALYLASYTLDNLLFSQAGLGSRVLLLHRGGVALWAAVGSQVADKVMEVASLVCLLLPILQDLLDLAVMRGSTAPSPAWALVLIAAFALARPLLRWLRQRPAWHDAVRAASGLRAPRVILEIVTLTLLGWLLELAMVVLVAQAFTVSADPRRALVLLVLVSAAMLIPGLPANIGPFEAAAALGFQAMGLSREQALAAALLYHAVHTIPVTMAGLPLLRWVSAHARSATA